MHIVVVEESTTNCRIIHNSFMKMGYENIATFVDTGAVLSHIKQYRTDFLVMGKQLKNTTGFHLAEQIRTVPGYAHLPILMVASHYIHADVLKGTDSGVSGFLLLPFSPRDFERKVTELFEQHSNRWTDSSH